MRSGTHPQHGAHGALRLRALLLYRDAPTGIAPGGGCDARTKARERRRARQRTEAHEGKGADLPRRWGARQRKARYGDSHVPRPRSLRWSRRSFWSRWTARASTAPSPSPLPQMYSRWESSSPPLPARCDNALLLRTRFSAPRSHLSFRPIATDSRRALTRLRLGTPVRRGRQVGNA